MSLDVQSRQQLYLKNSKRKPFFFSILYKCISIYLEHSTLMKQLNHSILIKQSENTKNATIPHHNIEFQNLQIHNITK